MFEHAYVIRWSRIATFGVEECIDAPCYLYVDRVRFSVGARGVDFVVDRNAAIKFGSWAEAAACAVFIIHHVDEMYDDALDIVKIDL